MMGDAHIFHRAESAKIARTWCLSHPLGPVQRRCDSVTWDGRFCWISEQISLKMYGMTQVALSGRLGSIVMMNKYDRWKIWRVWVISSTATSVNFFLTRTVFVYVIYLFTTHWHYSSTYLASKTHTRMRTHTHTHTLIVYRVCRSMLMYVQVCNAL